ncbi:MAG: aromatic ring-hydroxylating dioxygenase subunit alpha, partial [Porticoccaceae bacterium]|nr:aromatic ring-hydroxylating dioxygenase subunit alpha [Porticoccaceae bacterium]
MSNNNYQNIIRLRDLDAVNQPIAEATGMPGAAYTSDQLFDFERDHLMANSWAGLTFASDVQSNG